MDVTEAYSVKKRSLPAGQLSNTCLAMSVAESFGEKVKSCVFPLTRMRRRCTCGKNTHISVERNDPTRTPNLHYSVLCWLWWNSCTSSNLF